MSDPIFIHSVITAQTMTMRYAHLANSTLKQAMNAVGQAMHPNDNSHPKVAVEI